MFLASSIFIFNNPKVAGETSQKVLMFEDGFEGKIANFWDQGTTDVSKLSTVIAHSGSYSYLIDSTEGGLVYRFGQEINPVTNGTWEFEAWFYDNMTVSAYTFGLATDAEFSLLLASGGEFDTYYGYGRNTAGTIPRSIGWHKVNMIFTPQNATILVDGVQLYQTVGPLTFNRFFFGDWWSDRAICYTYYDDIKVWNTPSTATNPAPLTVLINLPSTTIQTFKTTTLTINVAGGVPPYTYQWYSNGSPISGASSANFIFTSQVPGKFGISIRVTDSKGYTTTTSPSFIEVCGILIDGNPIDWTTLGLKPVGTDAPYNIESYDESCSDLLELWVYVDSDYFYLMIKVAGGYPESWDRYGYLISLDTDRNSKTGDQTGCEYIIVGVDGYGRLGVWNSITLEHDYRNCDMKAGNLGYIEWRVPISSLNLNGSPDVYAGTFDDTFDRIVNFIAVKKTASPEFPLIQLLGLLAVLFLVAVIFYKMKVHKKR